MSSSLAFEGRAVAGAAVWMAVWWMTEAVPIPVTSLLPIVLFSLFGMGTMAEVASPYANSVVFLVMGGVILGLATEKAYLLENHDYDMQFGRWMLVGAPWAIVMLLIAWVVLTKLVFRAEVDRIPGGAEMIRGELAKLGPMTTPERRIALIFATAIFFWVAVPFIADIPAVADVARGWAPSTTPRWPSPPPSPASSSRLGAAARTPRRPPCCSGPPPRRSRGACCCCSASWWAWRSPS